jgi:hypothetical protein
MNSRFILKQNDKGHWVITVFRLVENTTVKVGSYTCLDLEAAFEVLHMVTGSQHVIIEESA